jgi:alkylation response protein AidB-like acyl-CoA dehydrogenase
MDSAGFFRLWLPRSLDGDEANLETGLRVVEEVSRYDGAAGWNLSIGVASSAQYGFLSEATAKAMLADGKTQYAAGATNPGGTATPVDGGYRVSGHWRLASGSQNASWLGGNCIVIENGAPRMAPMGMPDFTMFFFPQRDCRILDTWYSTGLRGTGSHDFVVEDVFVPSERMLPMFTQASAYQKSVLYQTNLINYFGPALGVVSLGIARDAIETFVALAAEKTPTLGHVRLAESDSVQMLVGKAAAKLNSARSYLYETVAGQLWAKMGTGELADEDLNSEILLAITNAAHSCAEAVDLVHSVAGTSAIYQGSRIERCFRDIHMIPQHFLAAPSNYVRAGALRLGVNVGLGR